MGPHDSARLLTRACISNLRGTRRETRASMASIVIELDSFFGSILNFPEHYERFKNDYIYDHFLNGTWSTSTDYVFDHKELNIPYDQIFFILTLIFGAVLDN